jgi:hypothetical protein
MRTLILTRQCAFLLGCHEASVRRWIRIFDATGDIVDINQPRVRNTYSSEVLSFIERFVNDDPTFYLEEL